MAVIGHYWTVRGFLDRRRVSAEIAPAEPWSATVNDPDLGDLRLTGRLSAREGDTVVVLVHGLGGCAESGYVLLAAAAAARQGLPVLSLNIRGADRRGEDYFHGGLTADIAAAVESPELASYTRIALLGFSLGGHMALRYVIDRPDPRLAAVATICTPLDLKACCTQIDRPSGYFYRRYLLDHLLEIYREVAVNRDVPLSVEEADRIRTQWDFDDRIVAPRWGFAGADDYYQQMSVGPDLGRLRIPTLLVMGEEDPMVPAASLDPFVTPAPPHARVAWRTGGHVGFPEDLDLGQPGPLGLAPQALSWLAEGSRGAC